MFNDLLYTRRSTVIQCMAARLLFAALVAAVALGSSQPAHALMVGATPGVAVDTSMNPATPGSGWTQGDPGFANVAWTTANLNAVYIGDGWMLSAFHTGVNQVKFTESGQSFDPIPGTERQISNADLRLYRIKGDPTLLSPTIKPVSIATQPLAVNDEVMFIANGLYRDANELSWTVTVNPGLSNDVWTQVGSCSGSNCYHGYGSAGYGKRWGTNLVEDDQAIFGASENDANITIAVGGTTIANLTQYTKQTAPCGSGSNCFETQVISGDSGSGVFHKRNGAWELAGITANMYAFDGQNTTQAVYGDVSALVDLSSYATEISTWMNDHRDYSKVGDVNLDGVISGNGTGPASSDDVTAFIQGWRYQQTQASVESWKKGDLNRDGVTNFGDFLLLRNALIANGQGAAAEALSSTLGVTGVPEPSTVMLVLAPVLLFALRARLRRSRLAA